MLTEEQVLQKLASYKDAIIKIKNDRDKARSDYADLKEKSYHTIKHLVEDNIEVKEKEIEELKTQLNSSTNDIQNLKNSLEQKDIEFNNLHLIRRTTCQIIIIGSCTCSNNSNTRSDSSNLTSL